MDTSNNYLSKRSRNEENTIKTESYCDDNEEYIRYIIEGMLHDDVGIEFTQDMINMVIEFLSHNSHRIGPKKFKKIETRLNEIIENLNDRR